MAAHQEGDNVSATAQLEESLAEFRALRIPQGVARVLDNLGTVAVRQGMSEQAGTFFREALTLRGELDDKRGIAESLEGLAAVAVSVAQFERAATLIGAAAALREAIGGPMPPARRSEQEDSVNRMRTALGEPTFNEAWTRGGRMSRKDAVAFGLEEAWDLFKAPRDD